MSAPAERPPRKPGGPGAARRSAARLAAVQALYQIDHSAAPASVVLEEFLRYRLGESFDTENDVAPDKTLFTQIVRGVTGRGTELDEPIAAALTERWKLDRLEIILRAILRAGVYELLAAPSTPARVVITEYVDVAHAFYEGQEPGMVNGLLDRIARRLRPAEFGAAEGDW
jgi:N utilization substance protein B